MRKQYKQNTNLLYIFPILVIWLIQFSDSFCSNLYYKLQSLFIIDFLVDGKGLETDFAISYFNLAMLPCYIITSFAPAARSLVDKWGKRPILMANFFILMTGCTICMSAKSLLPFLLGNAIVTFSCSMDIQCIFIVDEIPTRFRGTIYGCSSAIYACASMLIPLMRNLFIGTYHLSWRSIYAFGMGIVIFVFIIILLLFNQKRTRVHTTITKIPKSDTIPRTLWFKSAFLIIKNHSSIRRNLLLIFILGIATAGVSFYNEPLISFSITNESEINQSLLMEPVILLLVSIFSGYLSDHINRYVAIRINLFISGCSILLFLINLHTQPVPFILGIAWGAMTGSYFSSIDQLTLIIMELVPRQDRGKISALTTYLYGAGDAIGMLTAGLLSMCLSMEIAKLLLTLPIFAAAWILLMQSKSQLHKC